MALFGKKKKDDAAAAGNTVWQPQPHKAAKFFEHAKTVAQTGNFSYAIDLYARGLRFDPGNMAAHEAIYEAGIPHLQSGGKAAAGKEVKAIDGPNPADRMAAHRHSTWGICNTNNDPDYAESGQILQGSFSAVSKPKFASKYSLE